MQPSSHRPGGAARSASVRRLLSPEVSGARGHVSVLVEAIIPTGMIKSVNYREDWGLGGGGGSQGQGARVCVAKVLRLAHHNCTPGVG